MSAFASKAEANSGHWRHHEGALRVDGTTGTSPFEKTMGPDYLPPSAAARRREGH